MRSGYETYFGVNGPAVILFSLGYGITDRLMLTVGHSNYLHEWELSTKWRFLSPEASPLRSAFSSSISWITEESSERETFDAENFNYHLQLSLAYRLKKGLSLLLVPAYSTVSEYWDGSRDGTLALGTAARWSFSSNYALFFEWVPVLQGFRAAHNSWGTGVEIKIGGHVFHVFINNSTGMTSGQFLNGGDLDFRNNDYRFGFNIFRTFWF